MIDLIAAAGIGGIIGAGVMAALTVSKVADANAAEARADQADEAFEVERDISDGLQEAFQNEIYAHNETKAAHTRCSDALETARNRIERALEQITPGANATVLRIARILRGEQG